MHDDRDPSGNPKNRLATRPPPRQVRDTNTPGSPPGRPDSGGNLRLSRSVLCILILSLTILILVVLHKRKSTSTKISYSQFNTLLNQKKFKKVVIKDNGENFTLVATSNESTSGDKTINASQITTQVPATTLDGNGWFHLTDLARKNGTEVDLETK